MLNTNVDRAVFRELRARQRNCPNPLLRPRRVALGATLAYRMLAVWGFLLLMPTLGMPGAAAADPNPDPPVEFAYETDPRIELPTTTLLWPEDLAPLWEQALRQPKTDLQREAADSIVRASELGMPGLEAMTDELVRIVTAPDAARVARTAAARALVAIDARSAADDLAKAARQGPIELRLVVEPALAAWDVAALRADWLRRVAEPSTSTASRQLAIELLGEVGEPDAIEPLRRWVNDPAASPVDRLTAAKALARLPAEDLLQLAENLGSDPAPEGLVARLVGVHLLSEQTGPAAIAVLDDYATDSEPAVAAQAMERLLEIAPEKLVARAAATVVHADARIRQLSVAALATDPSARSITLLAPVLDDGVPAVRDAARKVLLQMAAAEELRPVVIAETLPVLQQDRWRGIEQATLILTELQQPQIAQRLLELLQHPRPEVLVAASWGLRELAVPAWGDAMFAEAQRLAAITSTPEITPATVKAAAYLLEATGRMTHRPADPYLRTFIPKNAPYPEAVRAAAIWSLGFLWAGRADEVADLIEQLETRLADIGNPPELVHVRAMAAIALGRFGAESSVPALRQWYEGDGPGSYVGARCGWAITQMTDESFPDPPSPTRRLPGWFLEPPDRLAGG